MSESFFDTHTGERHEMRPTPRSLAELDGFYNSQRLTDNDPPPIPGWLSVLAVALLCAALLLLSTLAVPDTKAPDCRTDRECQVLKAFLKNGEKK